MSQIEFWDGAVLDVNLGVLAASAVAVKGTTYANPCRLIEIYGNENSGGASVSTCAPLDHIPHGYVWEKFLPTIPGVELRIGSGIYHPPFVWGDCAPEAIANSFAYTTNAIYRILRNLAEAYLISSLQIDPLLDNACLLLTAIYKANNHAILKGINNNLNMYLVSKVIETLVGQSVYNAEYQEMDRTDLTLRLAIGLAEDHVGLAPRNQMALALGKGIAFLERHARSSTPARQTLNDIKDVCYGYTEAGIVIDDRDKLIGMVADADSHGRQFIMCAILDDTAETIDDLLWMQGLMELFPCFHVNLLVNTAQISINFASPMLSVVLRASAFRGLSCRLGTQLTITETYCPLISFQNNLLDMPAKKAVARADIVFVKGLNFFETCQLHEKDTFYAFVVYGPVSRMYTGLPDLSGVFAFIPAGVSGYRHYGAGEQISDLSTIWRAGFDCL